MDGNSDFDSADSDEELQTAIANNLLKPGLNIEIQPRELVINRKDDMENILNNFRLNLNWVERLDYTSMTTTAEQLEEVIGDAEHASVNNDFQRELCFYKQAQSAVLSLMPKLQMDGIPTKRPDDYFAEMAKSDLHMKRIREKLIAQEIGMEKSEKAKKLRAARKFGKQVQIDILKKRAQEKKKMLEEVKKYRKGQKDKLDFLDDIKIEDEDKSNKTSRRRNNSNRKETQNQPNSKRQSKNERFGFGGKKKRSKSNNAKSFDELSPIESMMMNQSSRKHQNKKQKGTQKQRRLGKNRRNQSKFRNKKK
ncbi:probable rRNA-processing protein EBP2 [Octopus bimaculoides]|uniref:EBNA1 binding protein 2 n=1 Tax=Octopus bimaculoides TaxID=37653 RepID=A0A0L8I5B9_OCTBM|nr:probable rRNA-processing protein EBP2 [Octopus bimaculoides]|eukprot:XP_014790740.1 PREDICTED: probable rRNA-processing protein EBP2 [Octopus bimaculoides]